MQEKEENSVVNNNPAEETPAPQAGMISRLAGGVYDKTSTVVGGVYNKTSTVVGGVTWVAGSAVSSTFGVIKGAGGYVNIWKKKEKCKNE